jgi:hypothetical protein
MAFYRVEATQRLPDGGEIMPRNLYTPSTSPISQAPDRLLLFIQRAQLELVYSRRRERRLPLHDSFRLSLTARSHSNQAPAPDQLGARLGSMLRPTISVDPGSGNKAG